MDENESILSRLREKVGGTSIAPPSPSSLGESPSPVINETYHHALDDAATLLLNMLTSSVRDYLIELADLTLKIPRWQLVLGGVMAQYEGGNSAAPSIDPAWRDVEAIIGRSICALPSCKKEFPPKRYGQLFCSQDCGDEARRLEMVARHQERDKIETAKKKFIKEHPTDAALIGLIE